MKLASYAVNQKYSPGREHPEEPSTGRNEFERDCARVVHSQAWRRLQYKTQVFSNDQGDCFRTRSSHSLEVAKVSKNIAQALNLNEDLAEVLALAHDLGHAPFGHTGQDALNHLMEHHGGFEHNIQALRIVDHLEEGYLHCPGLNLMFETREGLLKHCNQKNAPLLGVVAKRHLDGKSSTLEAQVVNLCDAIAYNHADLEDGYIMGFITIDQLKTLPLFATHYSKFTNFALSSQKREKLEVIATLRSMFGYFSEDLKNQSKKNIVDSHIVTLNDVRESPELIKFSSEALEQHYTVKKFLRDNLYNHATITTERELQVIILKKLFKHFSKHPEQMQGFFNPANEDVPRQVCDYIAGMTDRFALAQFNNLSFRKNKDVVLSEYPKYNMKFKK